MIFRVYSHNLTCVLAPHAYVFSYPLVSVHNGCCLCLLISVWRLFLYISHCDLRVFGPLCESRAISRKNPLPLCDNQEKTVVKRQFSHVVFLTPTQKLLVQVWPHSLSSVFNPFDCSASRQRPELFHLLLKQAVKISRVCILIMRSSLEWVWICETSPPASTMLPIANAEYRLCVRALITAELWGRPEQPSPQDG